MSSSLVKQARDRWAFLWWEDNTSYTTISAPNVGLYLPITRDETHIESNYFRGAFGTPIKVSEAGDYRFEWLSEMVCGTPLQEIGIALYISGEKRSINGRTKILPFSGLEVVYGFMRVDLEAEDTIELRVANFTGPNNILVKHNRGMVMEL